MESTTMPVCRPLMLQSDAIFASVWKASLESNQESAIANPEESTNCGEFVGSWRETSLVEVIPACFRRLVHPVPANLCLDAFGRSWSDQRAILKKTRWIHDSRFRHVNIVNFVNVFGGLATARAYSITETMGEINRNHEAVWKCGLCASNCEPVCGISQPLAEDGKYVGEKKGQAPGTFHPASWGDVKAECACPPLRAAHRNRRLRCNRLLRLSVDAGESRQARQDLFPLEACLPVQE